MGVATVAAIVAIVAFAATLFRGGLAESAPVTVISPRAGLVMNPDAKVQIRGVQVGKVASIEQLPNGEAALHLAMDPKRLNAIPSNVLVDIASTTVFGAKYVQLVSPPDPSPESLRAGQVLNAQHVMVEINTVFEELTSVLSKIDPPKLNEALGGIASAVNGRGDSSSGSTKPVRPRTTRRCSPTCPASSPGSRYASLGCASARSTVSSSRRTRRHSSRSTPIPPSR
jgi:virulence factor Mce-like protein